MDTEPLTKRDIFKLVLTMFVAMLAIFVFFSGIHQISGHLVKKGTEKCIAFVCIGEVDYGEQEPPQPF
jgi:hypothetical protein